MNSENATAPAEQRTLYYRQGSSDKVYQCSIEPHGEGFVVSFAFGRRGSTLKTGTKTSAPVDYETARQVFQNLIREKLAKGYTSGENGTPYQHTDHEQRNTGILPQLLNAIEEDEVNRLLGDPEGCMQEKKDGQRLLIRKEGEGVTGINRRGLIVGLASTIVRSAQDIDENFLLDGECVGDVLYVFDLLQRGQDLLLTQPYRARWHSLIDLLDYSDHPHIELLQTAFEAEEKRTLIKLLRTDRREGIVFKRLDAPYTPGRPSTGGTQVKHKFYVSLSAVVGTINAQRSVGLRLFDGRSWRSAGNVTIPVNQPIPALGSVIEVRYLYAYRESGSLYQPVYLGLRSDVAALECKTAQLKFRRTSEEEEP